MNIPPTWANLQPARADSPVAAIPAIKHPNPHIATDKLNSPKIWWIFDLPKNLATKASIIQKTPHIRPLSANRVISDYLPSFL